MIEHESPFPAVAKPTILFSHRELQIKGLDRSTQGGAVDVGV